MISYHQYGECRKLADVPPGAEILAVNNRSCYSLCEACGRPVLEGQDYDYDTDGVWRHVRCIHKKEKP